MAIQKVKFRSNIKQITNFEIVTLEQFFRTRPKKHLESHYRLNFWVLLYIIKGKGIHYIDFQPYPYSDNTLIVMPRYKVNAFVVNHQIEGYIINIEESFFYSTESQQDLDLLSFFQTGQYHPTLSIQTSKDMTSRVLIDLIYREFQMHSKQTPKLIKALFQSFIYSIRLEDAGTMKQFSSNLYAYYYDFTQLIETHCIKWKTVEPYAETLKITRKTLNLACRTCSGLSAKETITNHLIIEIKRLLLQNTLKNYEIADLLGFDEPANMSNFFKRYTNMSMNEFKKRQNTITFSQLLP